MLMVRQAHHEVLILSLPMVRQANHEVLILSPSKFLILSLSKDETSA